MTTDYGIELLQTKTFNLQKNDKSKMVFMGAKFDKKIDFPTFL